MQSAPYQERQGASYRQGEFGSKRKKAGRPANFNPGQAGSPTYMRRMTTTINYSRDLPSAQGIRFAVDAP
jgi:hypothetical protein